MTQNEHDNVTDHGTIIVDDDSRFAIDINTREITNIANKKTSLIQYDHNSERISFEVKRMVEGHDMLLCNKVRVHYTPPSGQSRTKPMPGLYNVTDLQVHPTDSTKVCFSWLISENVTRYDGKLSFLISFECVDGEDVVYRWNSGICDSIVVVPGMNNGDAIIEQNPDMLYQWELYMHSLCNDLATELKNTTIPYLVDECYVEKVFATSAEVAAVFGVSV